jgi:predicted helicase
METGNFIQSILHKVFIQCCETKLNLFDSFLETCHQWYERPAHTLNEIKMRENTKVKGDIFELFSVLYLLNSYKNVWLLRDLPDDILLKLGLKRRDTGIDIIAEDTKGGFVAVQCKYKRNVTTKKQNVLSWKSLSTFYAMCLRTGPWKKYIVITNCDYCRHQGKKTWKDVSICLKTLQKIPSTDWLKMCGESAQVLEQSNETVLTPEQMRQKRLERFS